MSKSDKSNTDQQQFWQMVFETFKTSDLSVRNFCKQEGLSEPAFYAWRKKLTQSDESNVNNDSAFIRVSMPKNPPAALELVLSSGNTLKIPCGIESEILTDVISVLSKAGLC